MMTNILWPNPFLAFPFGAIVAVPGRKLCKFLVPSSFKIVFEQMVDVL
jgi:hypothetical protein